MLMLCYSESLQNEDKAKMVINCLMSIAGNIIIHIYYLIIQGVTDRIDFGSN